MAGRRATALILLLALVVRVGVVIATPGFTPSGDPADYETHARSLLDHGAYPPTALAEPYTPSAMRPPAYPVLLAGAYALPGDDRTAGRLLGALLGTLSVGLLIVLAGRIFGPRTGRWAGLVAALSGPLVWLNASLLSESLFVPLVLGLLLCLERHGRRPSLGTAAAAGALAGAAMLTRSNGVVLLLPLLGALLLAGRDRRALAAGGVALAAVALALAPWTIRNAARFDRLLPLGTQGGYTAAGQWNEVAAAPGDLQAVWRLSQDVPSLAGLFGRPGVDEAELDAALRRRALAFARERPRHVATALGLNTLRLLDLGPGRGFTTGVALGEMGVPESQRAGLRVTGYATLLLALAGCALLLTRGPRPPWWLWVMPVALFLSVAPLSGSPRYRGAVEPFVAIAAAVAIVRLTAYRQAPTAGRATRSG